jgi:uncharacterized membrane protein YbhN (UPF0104 family)
VTRYRWLLLALGAVSAVLAVRFALRFPWDHTLQTVADADWLLLGLASVANVASLGLKGWAWHLLLRPSSPHRWRTAQTATLVGAAVGSVSVSVSGEAARLQVVAGRDGLALEPGIASLVWSRILEGVALVVVLAAALAVFPGESGIAVLRWTVWGALLMLALLWLSGLGGRLLSRLPAKWRPALPPVPGAGVRYGLVPPILLSAGNWFAQWLAFYWAIVATHISTSPAVALVALIAANLGGLLRLTPGNIGVLQASIVVGLQAFAIPGDQALAAGLALQAVQVLPVMVIGIALVGIEGFRNLSTKRPGAAEAA